MAALTADDVTVTLAQQDRDMMGIAIKVSYPTIAFGGAGKTYPANGIPMPAIGHFGMNKAIKFVTIMQPHGNGYHYRWDLDNHKLRVYYANHDMLFIGGITATEPVAIQGGDTLGKNAATNRTVSGASYATKGGVVPTPLTEVPTTHAPAATTIKLKIEGN